jgi:hypothetical protein
MWMVDLRVEYRELLLVKMMVDPGVEQRPLLSW